MAIIAKGGKPLIFVHDADLSSNGRTAQPVLNANSVDVSTFNDSGVKRKIGTKDISYRFDGLFDGASQKSHAALNDLRTNQRVVSIYPNADTAGQEGVVLSSALAEQYAQGVAVGEAVPLSAQITQDGVEGIPKSMAARHTANITATEQKASVDNSASSSNGGTLTIHVFVFSASGGNAQWKANLQESSDDGAGDAWATIASITISAVGASQVTWSGATERYLRIEWELDATSGTLQAHAGAERN